LAGSSISGQSLRQPVDLLGDEVVVLRCLQRDVDTDGLAELAGPHAGAVDDQLGFDVALIGSHPVIAPPLVQHAGRGDALDDRRALRRAPFASAIVTSTGLARPSSLT
jgi:hypothetical protein